MPVVVIGDWDADGFVSAAEVVFSQEVVGAYPVRGKHSAIAYPSTPRALPHLLSRLAEVRGNEKLYLVLLDIAFTEHVKAFIRHVKKWNSYIVYVDHHLPTLLHQSAVERIVDELIVGKRATAFLTSVLLKSLGVKMTERLSQFIDAVTHLESGLRYSNTKLAQLIITISKAVTLSRDALLWERVVRWLSSPLTHIALPYNISDVKRIVRNSAEYCNEKALALDLAPTAIKLFNYRVVKLRKQPDNCRFSAIVTALYRVFKSPVIVYSEEKNLLAVRTRNDKAYAISMKLYNQGLARDVMGHERLAIMKLAKEKSFDSVLEALRKILIEIG
jgi:hypothetical protein